MGGPNVVGTATLTCTWGAAPSTMSVLPTAKVLIEGQPAATIMDVMPMVNVPPFGMCSSMSNPTVAAATAAALGVLTPMPCVPLLPAPWTPGSATTLIGGKPALTNPATCNCAWGGVITVTMPGAVKTITN
ncbi:DUF4280 domain-containing protein [Nocardioides sp. Iso805N]|uniref:DUF4280 domain-containing protein n=1 Tax=Nocardioides sp. Iso805N TaxID=1283287 RepID=UPI00039D65F2|nr:DUF4280 domain-containing protein [Nocardioides sp. Iso805N]